MLLAIDIGNTTISFGVFDISFGENKSKLIFSSDISSAGVRSVDEYAVSFIQLFRLYNCDIECVSCVAVSSVVPHLTGAVCDAVTKLFDVKPYMIAPGVKTGFKIAIDDPATLGADIVSNIASALELAAVPLVVFDAGTANTLTFVDSNKNVCGTIISPGLRISLEALTDNAEQIEAVMPVSHHIPLIGKNTFESISSGVILGNAMMVDGFIRNIREKFLDRENGEKLSLIATGDYCELICENTRNKFIIDKNLTLNGIAALYLKNHNK